MLHENAAYLRTHFKDAWNAAESVTNESISRIRVEPSRNQGLTMAVLTESGWNYLHSKYDPIAEAERLVNSFQEVDKYEHVFFYGVGLGHHIDAFMNRYHDLTFSIYEPHVDIFREFISHYPLHQWTPTQRLQHVMVETRPEDLGNHLSVFTDFLNKEVLVVVLPSYERIFAEQTSHFLKMFREIALEKREHLLTGKIFARRMAINGLVNVPYMLKHGNILHGHGGMFKGKPAIIVSAGPSLNEEYENLRYIKENGLAYIFSAGTAVNSLIHHDIYPDAAFSYDGSSMNMKVFEKIIDEQIDDIPLVFGCTINFETVQRYPGKMVNFFVRNDYVMDLFLKRRDGGEFACTERYRSIATVTLQILAQIGCNPIILVGQNFAYRDNRFYAQGIEYVSPELTQGRKEYSITVPDVYGNPVMTSRGYTNMRLEMEELIRTLPSVEVINTTKGGAHIEGTTFFPLERVIQEKLLDKHVVRSDWIDNIQNNIEYDLVYFKKRVLELLASYDEFERICKRFTHLFDDMKSYLSTRNLKQLEDSFNKFDKLFDRLQQNTFNLEIVQKMNFLEFRLIMKMFDEVRFHPDAVAKAQRVIDEFENYLSLCRRDAAIVKPLLLDMKRDVLGETVTA